ncbi:MAG: hypothetical protein KDC79_02175 [Cyclobacteriaceae bacterium]|nr:hypothetical protein [Cyclobacteriaceae bacterium]
MKLFYKIAIAIIIYGLMAIPDPKEPFPIKESDGYSATSAWWGIYAQNLVKYRIINSAARSYYYDLHRTYLNNYLDEMELELTEPDSPILDSISYQINKLSALASLVPNKINEFELDISRWRKLLKYQSRFWNTSAKTDGNRLYQLLVESRLAFESALVQSNSVSVSWSMPTSESEFPSIETKNILFQSGDIVAFNLAKENGLCLSFRRDMPNAYDHLGSVYITDGKGYLTYIDKYLGLQSVTLETFLDNYAPNGMVLRIRADLPEVIDKPQLPVLAADALYKMSESGKYKYDYQLDLDTWNYLYDWEMLNDVYKQYNLKLGTEKKLSNTLTIRIGSDKLIKEPYELEYDPKLLIVGEWYNTKTLYDKRILTAATSSIILSAKKMEFVNPLLLPLYRLEKAYSMILNQFGFKGPIPQGISAQNQMALNALHKKQKQTVKELNNELAKFEKEQKHKATYLKMLQSAKEIKRSKVADL